VNLAPGNASLRAGTQCLFLWRYNGPMCKADDADLRQRIAVIMTDPRRRPLYPLFNSVAWEYL
jgi:hypothetical protein